MQAGSRVGQYILERPIGQGAITEVWLARNVYLKTPAAVRFLRTGYSGRAELSRLFLVDAKRQGQLVHPNIVRVFGWEYFDDLVFAILEYIDGESLADRLRRVGRLSAADMVGIAGPILSALDYARERGVLHLDLKPSNILLDRNGTPFVSDFRMREPAVASPA